MTEEKIKSLINRLRHLTPKRGDWMTLLDDAALDAIDALESQLVKIDEFRRLAEIKSALLALCEARKDNAAVIEAKYSSRKAPVPLTDLQIKDAADAIDFGKMVTADDFIYMIARAVLEAQHGTSVAAANIEPNLIDHYWKVYQTGRGSADHTDKEAFSQTLQLFAESTKDRK
jgi:hypothetical protein